MLKNHRPTLFSIYVIADTARCSGRGILQGILRYSMHRDAWQIRVIDPTEAGIRRFLDDLANGRIDGIITSFLENNNLVHALERSTVPLVVIGTRKNSLPTRHVNLTIITFNEQAIGSLAARHFRHLGKFRTLAFVPHQPLYLQHVSSLRAKGFAAELAAAKCQCVTFSGPPSDTTPDIDKLAAWLENLPRPIAILCGHDKRALDVFTACERCGINIPHEAMLLGVDNDVFACRSVKPEISSIETDFDNEAFTASKLLDDLLRRHTPTTERKNMLCNPNCKIISRGSTHVLAPGTELVNRARAYIAANAAKHLTANEVISYLHTAKRTVYLRFAQFSDKTLQETITEARLKHVKERLRSSHQTIDAISRELGFNNVNNLKRLFKNATGMTMREFRNHK